MTAQIDIDREAIAGFCRRWHINELALFGSVVTDDFRPDSDVDVLVSFAPEAEPSLFDLVQMRDELRSIFGREVDLLTRRAVESSRNPERRRAMLSTAQTIYRARGPQD